MEGEQVRGPIGNHRRLCQVFVAFDGVFGSSREVMCALGFGEAWEMGAGMGKMRQDLIEDFDRKCLELAALWDTG